MPSEWVTNPEWVTNRPYNTHGIYSSYSGADIVATITPVGGKPYVFGELQTISYSIHRDKFPVRALGSINPKGFSMGGRTIAGSLIFTVFDRHVLKEAIDGWWGWDQAIYGAAPAGSRQLMDDMKYRMVTDEMPPFDVTVTFMNEYGVGSVLRLYGVTIVDEGQVMSIEDMITENTMSFMARDIQLLDEVGRY